ncbi:MAG: hypothetical protein JWR70_1229 [Modestobacter sp.]|jgi:hypothetical protein|nr:hypothetical protein [Modestobacter sp.]
MPRSTRRTPTDRPGGSDPHVEPHGDEPIVRDEPAGAGPRSRQQDERTTMTLRLPFMTLSVSRPPQDPAPGAGEPAHRGMPGTAGAQAGRPGSGEQLLFYAGVAALGAAGVLEWPVAAAIAAGTYIATKTRPTPPAATGATGHTRSGVAAPTEVAGARGEVSTPSDA